ncbi:hypothetical protein EK21DRAFT_94449 [Setomelanomma holmii]|uniref:Dienelactone hydrolase domain-containing protein n=1 Tax=Setomelanomma holmii TaxID=210430 RepID=A0A9P4GZK0_9PLEO|nr:hypothetical protein EK21DRAFT_94449 [Setomelanomma holmii]
MDSSSLLPEMSDAFSIWDTGPIDHAFTLTSPNNSKDPSTAVVNSVSCSWLLSFKPSSAPNNCAILILGGGGYIELMVGREGIQVARWLCSLGFHCFVLTLELPEKQESYDVVQPDVQLRDEVPRTFVVYAGNDKVVPVVNAYRLAQAIQEKRVGVEVHVFADAPHGFTLDTVGLPVSAWTGMCAAWMKQLRLFG